MPVSLLKGILHYKHDDSDRIDVALFVVRLLVEQFGSSVAYCASVLEVGLCNEVLRTAKVSEYYFVSVLVFEKDVDGLDVLVEEVDAVDVGNGLQNALNYEGYCILVILLLVIEEVDQVASKKKLL